MSLKTARVGGVPGNMAVLPDGKHAYIVRPDGSTVEILDTSTLEIGAGVVSDVTRRRFQSVLC